MADLQKSMGQALTSYAASKSPRRFRYRIVVTKTTRGGDIHLNGNRIVRVHPNVITSGTPIPQIIDRIFSIIEKKRTVYIEVREMAISDARAISTTNLQYLRRAMDPRDFQEFVEEVPGL